MLLTPQQVPQSPGRPVAPDANLAARKQGQVVPFALVDGPCAWKVADFPSLEDLFYTLTPADIAELEDAINAALATGAPIETLTRTDYPLPNLGAKLQELGHEAQFGRGFALIRGVPVDRWTRQQSMAAYWLMGTYWGKAQSQNKKGHLIGHIKDIGHDPNNPDTRLYATHEAQPFHNDAADLVSLLCLANAPDGGLSSWSSSISVHNEIIKRRPDLARVLAGPWFFDRKGEIPEGGQPYFLIPVFNYHEGYLSINYSENYFQLSQRHAEVPRFTQEHLDAMELFSSLAASDQLRFDYLLQPGDIQLLSNHTCLHARTAFTDHPDVNKRRHLLRLWLSPTDDRPLPECYRGLLGGSIEQGNRGGIHVPGAVTNAIPLEAE